MRTIKLVRPMWVNKPSSISGGRPPTNTFRENLSPVSEPWLWGEDRDGELSGGGGAAITCPSTRCDVGSSNRAAWSSNPGKKGDFPKTMVTFITKMLACNIS